MNATNNNSYFPELTGVRALAVLLVYLHHYNPFDKNIYRETIYKLVQEFHIGVTLFFVLSGFLIGYRYSEMKNFSFKKYMLFRFARIYPMFFILSTITFLIPLIYNENVFELNKLLMYVFNITFLKGFFDTLKFTLVSQSWSLTVEEVFYVLSPLFFLLIKRKQIYFFLIPITLICFGLLLVSVFSNFNLYGFFSSYEFMFNYTFFGRCLEFFIGIGLSLIVKKEMFNFNFKYFTLIGFLNIFVCVFFISLFSNNGLYGVHHPFGILINTFVLPLFGIAPFFYGLIHEKTIFSSFFGSKLLVLLGKSSYVFYLIHIGFFRNIFVLNNDGVWSYLYLFVILQIISIILFKTIEEPINDYLRGKFKRNI